MDSFLARPLIEDIIHKYIVLYKKSIDEKNKTKEKYYGNVIDALQLALSEMEQNDKFREAINEFTTL